MKTQTKLAISFLALAGLAGGLASMAGAKERPDGRMPRAERLFERADADGNGDVTFEEFAAAMDERLQFADGDGDGKMSVAEIAEAIQRMRAESMAARLVERLDEDGDGMLSKAELDQRRKEMFARLDGDGDGRITKAEMPARPFRKGPPGPKAE